MFRASIRPSSGVLGCIQPNTPEDGNIDARRV